ncbi:MgtC/SapB family protein [Acinetobacter sp. CUI P1]|uniref:MgtC/SapB family protein n=1 Tax=Acinetobacter junii TaxID=40215 RepID=UPI001BA65FBA|nr:MgtC/SapB family protein [Acinetobacter junii]MBY3625085.1 MgtC/SapB family protein [Acinetobacter sp. CUI P1]MDA3508914.1 MgtC/SapB family protein [Acinetobacter junii]MDA3533386.1 MgtC/SapB family protein [Acinetobacter junii]QUS51435.1 MgtC/SapB family protein [Acinetobacter junii]
MAELMNYSIQNTSFSQLMMIFAVSLGCGLLIGLERERSKSRHKTKTFAGFRTFAITSLLGTLCFLFNLEIGITGAILVGAISIASLRNQQDDPGVTTELAFIMTYFIGAVCIWNINLAAGLAVTLTILLFAKETLHGLANQWISETELRDGVLLLALILIGLPLAPDKAYWGPVLNPYTILKLLSLILLVQALAHFAKRLLSSRNAIVFSSLASGFVSSTATVANLGMEVRNNHADPKINAGAALMSCVATLVQMLIIVASISMAWLELLLIPSLISTLLLLAWSIYLLRKSTKNELSQKTDESRMFSFKNAIVITVALSTIQAAVYGLNLWLGNSGLIIGTFIASLFEIHAAIAAIVVQGDPNTAQATPLLIALMAGLCAHAMSKSINAGLTGGYKYALAFVPAQILHMAILVILVWVSR